MAGFDAHKAARRLVEANDRANSAPLPEYFSDKEGAGNVSGLLALLSSLGLGALAIPAPEAAPVLLPAAGLGAAGAIGQLNEAAEFGRGADMWRHTGLAQRPPTTRR